MELGVDAPQNAAKPVSCFARGLLKEHEYRRIKGLLAHVDELIRNMKQRDRAIRREYRALRSNGVRPGDAYWKLGEQYHLSEDSVQRIIYPRN